MRRTFKQLVDEVLRWQGRGNDTQMRVRVEDAIRKSHEMRNIERGMSYMLMPEQMLQVVPGRQRYSLDERFAHPLYIKNVTAGLPVVVVPYARLGEFSPDNQRTLPRAAQHASIHGVSAVYRQPLSASHIHVQSSNSMDDGQQVVIYGDTGSGLTEELLVIPTTSQNTYVELIAVTKIDSDAEDWTGWKGTVVATDDSGNELLSLAPTVYGRQFPQLEFLYPISQPATIVYRGFRAPRTLLRDNDIPDTPYPYDRLHILDALLSLQDFSRPDPGTVRQWERELQDLELAWREAYADVQAEDAEPIYGRVISR